MHLWQGIYVAASVIVNIIVVIDAALAERQFNRLGQSGADRRAGIATIGVFAGLVLWGSAVAFAWMLS